MNSKEQAEVVQPLIIADIYLLSREESGRTRPIISGYRPSLALPGFKSHWTISDFVVEPSPLEPGNSGRVSFRINYWDQVAHAVSSGVQFRFTEGYRVMAECRVINLEGV